MKHIVQPHIDPSRHKETSVTSATRAWGGCSSQGDASYPVPKVPNSPWVGALGKHCLEAAAPAHLPGRDVGSWHRPELLGLLLPLRLQDASRCPRSEQCFLPVELPEVPLSQSPFTSQYCI